MSATEKPCPSCGHCPTCGRGGHQAAPVWPVGQPIWVVPSVLPTYIPNAQPYVPYFTLTTSPNTTGLKSTTTITIGDPYPSTMASTRGPS